MRILMYSHDSSGISHLRRTLALAEAFTKRDPETNVLVVTGSTLTSAVRMARGVDLVKLPSVVEVGDDLYEPGRMTVDFESLTDLRSGLILTVAKAFGPDVFVVDKAPLGMKREVLPTLEYLRRSRPSTLTVLGLRDVLDEPSRVREHWREGRIAEAIEEFYDLILVYGPREVYDPISEYGLSEGALGRSHYVGYVGRNLAPVGEAPPGLPFEPGYVLVTAGGGGDGFQLVKTYLDGLRVRPPSYESVVVTGPLMGDEDKRRVEGLSRGLERVQVLEFRPDMERLIQGAGAVVAMGGYNTTTELLAARKPVVIVPRVEPRVEQLIRARRLAELGLVEMIHPEELTAGLLRARVEGLLEGAPAAAAAAVGGVEVDLSGADRAVELIIAGVAAKRATEAEA